MCAWLFIYTLCSIVGNILYQVSSCNEQHEGNLLTVSSSFHVTIWLMLHFTLPVFSHFLLANNLYFSSYCLLIITQNHQNHQNLKTSYTDKLH